MSAHRSHELDPTGRFSDRVASYVRSRPGYPSALLDHLARETGLTPRHVIADVGSSTGILTELFLKNGNAVIGVEPNDAMRLAAERLLGPYPNFTSVAGTAEATGLPGGCADVVAAGQAFHWFDVDKARAEFRRILKPGGFAVLVWNDRRLDRPAFAVAYEAVVRKYQVDLEAVHQHSTGDHAAEAVRRFFGPAGYAAARFDNPHSLDWEGVKSRLQSSSYMPPADDPRAAAMLEELAAAFAAHGAGGAVTLEYDTRAYYGKLG